MKTLITLLLLFFGTLVFSQVPQLFNYQAVARDISGNPLPNQAVALRISILSGSVSGNIDYQETHNSTTNQLGLLTLAIGAGTPQIGTFSMIDWGGGIYFIQVEMDVSGGTNYQLFGTSQLLSVPYALYAHKSGNGDKWSDNNSGIYYQLGSVVIGDTVSIDTTINSFRVYNKGGSYVNFVAKGGLTYPGIELYGTNVDNAASMYLADYINSEPTLMFGFNGQFGTARHFNFRSNSSNHLTILGTGMIGIGTINPARKLHVSDVMRLEPRSTAPSSPAEGDIYMDSTMHKLMVYDGTVWRACW